MDTIAKKIESLCEQANKDSFKSYQVYSSKKGSFFGDDS